MKHVFTLPSYILVLHVNFTNETCLLVAKEIPKRKSGEGDEPDAGFSERSEQQRSTPSRVQFADNVPSRQPDEFVDVYVVNSCCPPPLPTFEKS